MRVQLGAWLVETRLGRRWSLAGSTFLTALLCVLFVHARSPLALRMSTVGISLSSTVSVRWCLLFFGLLLMVGLFIQTMWAVLYG